MNHQRKGVLTFCEGREDRGGWVAGTYGPSDPQERIGSSPFVKVGKTGEDGLLVLVDH